MDDVDRTARVSECVVNLRPRASRWFSRRILRPINNHAVSLIDETYITILNGSIKLSSVAPAGTLGDLLHLSLSQTVKIPDWNTTQRISGIHGPAR